VHASGRVRVLGLGFRVKVISLFLQRQAAAAAIARQWRDQPLERAARADGTVLMLNGMNLCCTHCTRFDLCKWYNPSPLQTATAPTHSALELRAMRQTQQAPPSALQLPCCNMHQLKRVTLCVSQAQLGLHH
jgi:hypothetical protein